MSTDDVTKILDRALADGAYLSRLLSDPAKAAGEVGATLGVDEVAILTKMSADDFKQFASEYKSSTDPAKRRAAC